MSKLTFIFACLLSSISFSTEPILVAPPHSSFGPFILDGNARNCGAYSTYTQYCEQVTRFTDTLMEAIRFERKWKLAFGCSEKIERLRNCLYKKANLASTEITPEIKDYVKSIESDTLTAMTSNSQDPFHISGKWKAKKYLEWGIQNEMIVELKDMQMKPEHFGFLFFNLNQEITLKIREQLKSDSDLRDQADELLKVSRFHGELHSNTKIMDPTCTRVPYYKTHAACEYAPGSVLPLKFSLTPFDSPAFEQERTLIEERFAKNGTKDIFATLLTSHMDGSSGGTIIAFIGKKHLVLGTTYYAKPISPEEATSLKCPTGNTCTSTGLLFERVE